MKQALIKTINELIRKYVGGESYFNTLDDFIKGSEYYIKWALENAPSDKILILSGAFGERVAAYLKLNDARSYILLKGSPRTGHITGIYTDIVVDTKECVMIDDSYYLGTTYNYIRGYLRSLELYLDEIVVIYNGSKSKVKSLYNYYEENV